MKETMLITFENNKIHAVVKNDKDIVGKSEGVYDKSDLKGSCIKAMREAIIPSYVELLNIDIIAAKGWKPGDICKVIKKTKMGYVIEGVTDQIIQEVYDKDVCPVRLVHRCGCPGEYMMIKKSRFSFDYDGCIYQIADISETNADVMCTSRMSNHHDQNYLWHFPHHTYVIVEGYRPINHLKSTSGMHCGIMGELTDLRDSNGNLLRVGDVVVCIDKNCNPCTHFISECYKGYCIGELKDALTSPYKLWKYKDYRDVVNREVHGTLRAYMPRGN